MGGNNSSNGTAHRRKVPGRPESHSSVCRSDRIYSAPNDSLLGELCSKGYSRMNEFEAHESSYDHQHKKVNFSYIHRE